MPIRILPVQLANQIAAGEVVERPASAVKELLENAVDSGATRIVLETEGSGSQAIIVRDNGCGIPEDELPLALAPHATSKIACAEDLNNIRTLGFRGEALASIAAVSKLTLTSRVRGCDRAFSVQVRGLQQDSVVYPAAHPEGTSVEVRELFFNTPARRRFLRSARTEAGHIRDIFVRTALAHPELEFVYKADGKTVLQVRGTDKRDSQALAARTGKLIGSEYARYGIPVSFDGEHELSVHGLLLPASALESQAAPDSMYLFLNQRPVSDKVLTHALKEAFYEVNRGKCPVRAVLFVTCDPHEVDVNVHPRKDEVRFHESRLIHDVLAREVSEALTSAGMGQSAHSTEGGGDSSYVFPAGGISREQADKFNQDMMPLPPGFTITVPAAPAPATPDSAAAPVSVPAAASSGSAGTLGAGRLGSGSTGSRPGTVRLRSGVAAGAGAGSVRGAAGSRQTQTAGRQDEDEDEHTGTEALWASLHGGSSYDSPLTSAQPQDTQDQAQSDFDAASFRQALLGTGAEVAPLPEDTAEPAFELTPLPEISVPAQLPETEQAESASLQSLKQLLAGKDLDSGTALLLPRQDKALVLDLPRPDVILLKLEGRYFLLRGSLLRQRLKACEFMQQVQEQKVPAYDLTLPFAVKCEPSLPRALQQSSQAVHRLGFALNVSRRNVELLSVPVLLRGADLAALSCRVLQLLCAGASGIEEGRCPQQLALLMSKTQAVPVVSAGVARELAAFLPDAAFVQDMPGAQEIMLGHYADDLLTVSC